MHSVDVEEKELWKNRSSFGLFWFCLGRWFWVKKGQLCSSPLPSSITKGITSCRISFLKSGTCSFSCASVIAPSRTGRTNPVSVSLMWSRKDALQNKHFCSTNRYGSFLSRNRIICSARVRRFFIAFDKLIYTSSDFIYVGFLKRKIEDFSVVTRSLCLWWITMN